VDREERLKRIEERLKRIEEHLKRLDPPPRFASVEEYAAWRDAHGGGMAAAMVIGDGRSALRRLMEGAPPEEVEELTRRVINAVRLESRLKRASHRAPEKPG